MFALTGSAALAQIVFRNAAPWAGTAFGSLALATGTALLVTAAASGGGITYIAGSVIGGAGFGVAFLGALRALSAVIPAEHRAAVMSAFYIVAYATISLPAIAGGVVEGYSGVRPAFVVLGSAAAVVALVVAVKAYRTRPSNR